MTVKRAPNGTYTVQFRCKDAEGRELHKFRRGFATRSKAEEWERDYKATRGQSMAMKFYDFRKIYEEDMRPRLRETTWATKQHMIDTKIKPYFGQMRMEDIRGIDIIQWQNKLINSRRSNGEAYSPTYLRTINNQLNAIFNHASRYYGLNPNPAVKTMKIGAREAREMSFWTKEEYLKFSEAMMEKPRSFIMFEILYWTGIRVGELLALVPESFDLVSMEMRITSSYQRLDGQDLITDPKTRVQSNQALPRARDEEGMRCDRREEDQNPRPAPLPRESAHRHGVLRPRDRRPIGPGGHRRHLPLRPPLPQRAGGHGNGAQRIERR